MNSHSNRSLITEFFGSAVLLLTVVGVGVTMGRVPSGSPTELLIAVTAIVTIGSVIWQVANIFVPTQLNPLITLALVARGRIEPTAGSEHIAAQVTGGLLGVVVGNMAFGLEMFSPATQTPISPSRYVGEFLVSVGLVTISLVLFDSDRFKRLGILAPLWLIFGCALTSSPAFGNPAITVANSLSHTLTSDASTAIVGLLSAQLLGGILAFALVWLFKFRKEDQRRG